MNLLNNQNVILQNYESKKPSNGKERSSPYALQNSSLPPTPSQSNSIDLQKFKDIQFVKELCNKNKKFKEDLDIISFLNNGSCGMVYLGEIKKNYNKKVALKLLLNSKVSTTSSRKISQKRSPNNE